MSSKFSSAFVVTLLLSHAVLAPLTAIAQEQDASPQQVQEKNNSSLNESVSKNSSETSGDASQDSVAQESNQTVTETIDVSEVPDESVVSLAVSDDWEYTDKGTYCVITAYSGTKKDWVVPSEINGKPTKITEATFHSGRNPESVTIQAGRFGKVGVEGSSLEGLFQQKSTIKSIDLSGLDTSNVTDMKDMFRGTSALTNVNLNGLNTSNVTNMDHIFSGMANLETLDVSHFDTSKVTNMTAMFQGLSKIKKLDLRNFNTSKVNVMRLMFNDCNSLTDLNVTSFDTSNVNSMSNMFNYTSLQVIDLSSFKITSSVAHTNYGNFNADKKTPLTVIATDPYFFHMIILTISELYLKFYSMLMEEIMLRGKHS